LAKGDEGGFKRNNATLQQEVFENTQGALERIWDSLWFLKSPLAPLFQRGEEE
jgi:hypothetical protein